MRWRGLCPRTLMRAIAAAPECGRRASPPTAESSCRARAFCVRGLPVFSNHAGPASARCPLRAIRAACATVPGPRRRRPYPIDPARPVKLGDHQPIALLTEERVLPGEPIVIAARPVIAGERTDLDRILEPRQQIEPVDFRQADDMGGLCAGGTRNN